MGTVLVGKALMKALGRAAITVWLLFATAVAWAQVSLVPAGSAWKYLDTGVNAGTAWRASGFDDSTWRTGAAKLGYGDGDEVTVVSFGSNPNAKYITTYFRRAFTVANPASLTGLNLRVRRDDGIVVYLNGNEVYRDNMPLGTVAYTTLATTAAPDDGVDWQTATLPASGVVTGTNVLAVEVHQSAATSSDLTFDLELTAASSTSVASLTRGPYLQVGTPGGVTVRWRTSTSTNSVVRFGASAASLTASASDSSLTTEHSVTLTGLSANTRYYYSVGSSSATLAGGDNATFFVTSPAAGSPRATRVWVVGDAGTGTAEQLQVRDAYTNFTGSTQTDLWLQLGDNAYESGADAEYQSNVFNVYSDLLKRSVTWPAIGNHDTDQSTAPAASIPYFQSFSFPTAGQAGGVASGTKNYYSFDYANIHFVSLDSMASSRAPGSAMLTWLQNDLAANNKDWLVAYWHHPPYTKGNHDSDADTELIEMRQNVVPILEGFGVDLVLTGHSHAYERSFLIDGHYGDSSTFTDAMKKNGGSGRPAETGAYTKPLGPVPHQGAVYAVAGVSGHTSAGPLNHPAMFISTLRLGSMVLDVNGTRMDVRYLTEAGTVGDSFTIIKGGATNQLPTVSLTAPANGATYTAPATLNLAATAADSDGSIQRVEFYQGNTLLGTATTAPYTCAWSGVAAGSYVLTAKAYDNLGASSTSTSATITVNASGGGTTTDTLIAKQSVWKYLDNGTDQGTAWRFVGFNDNAWLSGPAQLGYGDGDEATVVSYGPNASSKYITTYFRRLFTVADASQYSALTMNLLRDDGAVVYLNGTEVTRSNMPSGSVTASTLASTAVTGSDESTFFPYSISTASLAGGTNVIAVEIHQDAANSSDISFDLELIGTRVAGNSAPTVTETAPASGAVYTAPASITLTAQAADSDGSIQRVDFYQGSTLLGTALSAPYTVVWTNVPAGVYSVTARATDNTGAITVSAPVTVTVNAATTGNHAPTLNAVANQSGTVGQSASLALVASDVDGDTLTYSGSGLPTGVTLNAATGSISGTPTAAGSYSVTAAVSDGRGGSASRSFVWTIAASGGSGSTAVQYVRLVADTEINGNAWTSMAEFNLLDATGAAMSRTGWTVSADSAELVGENAPASNAIDGDASTFWHTQWQAASPPPPHSFTVNLGSARVIGGFKYLPRPGGGNGTIANWRFFTSTDGTTWTQVAQGTFANSAAEKTVYPLSGVTADQPPTLNAVANQSGTVGQSASLALVATDVDGDTLTYSGSGLPTGVTLNAATGSISGTPTAAGSYSVTAAVSDGRGGSASRSFVWTIAASGGSGSTAVQYVRLVADTEINGNAWTSMAEFNLLDATGAAMSRTGWTVSADSAELVGENAPASNAIDGDASTFWHTQWQAASPPPPHSFTVNLGSARVIGGFKYLPRPGGGNGTIANWRFFTSTDGTTWTQVAQGTFAKSAAEKTVTLP